MLSDSIDLNESGAARLYSGLRRYSWLDKAPVSIGCGCLLGLSAPGFDLWWLSWIGLVPLLVLVQGEGRRSGALATGMLFGLGYYLVALSFYLGLYPLRWMGLDDWLGFQAAAFVWLAESAHQATLFALFALFVRALPMRAGLLPWFRRPYFPYILSVPVIWVFFQWAVATSESFLGLPVNQLAYSQWQQIELIQAAKFGGSQLIDFLIVGTNAALASLVFELSRAVPALADRQDRISNRAGAVFDFAAIIAVIAALFFWGRSEVERIAADSALPPGESARSFTPPVPVAVIQGNVSAEDEKLGSLTAPEICQRYAMLGHDLGVAMLFLPEAVITGQQMSAGLLFSQLEKITTVERKEALAGFLQPVDGAYANAVRLFTPRNEREIIYVKRRLVPFAEFIPVGPVAHILPEGIKHMFTGASSRFVRSSATGLIGSAWGLVGASISAEIVYPRLIADEVRQGAALILNTSNLAWFHGAGLNRQLLAAGALRAVENGRYVVMAANTGISAVISPSGLVTSASIPGRRGVILDTVQFLYRKMPYTRMWWL